MVLHLPLVYKHPFTPFVTEFDQMLIQFRCGRNIADADGSATSSGRNCGVNLNHTRCRNETATQRCVDPQQKKELKKKTENLKSI
jgi:hypothetical protein